MGLIKPKKIRTGFLHFDLVDFYGNIYVIYKNEAGEIVRTNENDVMCDAEGQPNYLIIEPAINSNFFIFSNFMTDHHFSGDVIQIEEVFRSSYMGADIVLSSGFFSTTEADIYWSN